MKETLFAAAADTSCASEGRVEAVSSPADSLSDAHPPSTQSRLNVPKNAPNVRIFFMLVNRGLLILKQMEVDFFAICKPALVVNGTFAGSSNSHGH
ncbi:hypothetical protein LZC95_48350 [Pendulispora brunnea]|uniref:Uncharacterized protein n=1 Tax=Pendulispora brunnea TaxID=2905690 RepID=A0ABZ2K6D3_9BACT